MSLRTQPLRPFTILPAGTTDRQRLQAQVFQPDHRLPTMSIDEYLAIEQERGNVITGGGVRTCLPLVLVLVLSLLTDCI